MPGIRGLGMFENLFHILRGMFRAVVQAFAPLATVMILCCALSIAKNQAPAGEERFVLVDLCPRQSPALAAADSPHIRFRHDERRRHVWIARFAALELRVEWDSDAGRDSWSASIQSHDGHEVAHAAATTESGRCI